MKHQIKIIFSTFLLSYYSSHCQDIDKLNKTELRDRITVLSSQIDSLKRENLSIQLSQKILDNENLSLLQKTQKNEAEIIRLNETISRIEIEKKTISTEKDDAILKFEKSLASMKDSLFKVQSQTATPKTSPTIDTSDFLNSYYFNQTPLNNNSYSLVLSKVIFGDTETKDKQDYYYGSENDKGAVDRLPELLDANDLTYWSVIPNSTLEQDKALSNYLDSHTSDYLNNALPKIEILKNKLFTLQYKNGKEESFLFNVSHTELNYDRKTVSLENNKRKILQIELANEDVNQDGTNSIAKDIVWRIFPIEDQCYLALAASQLERLNIELIDMNQGIEVINSDGYRQFAKSDWSYYQRNGSRMTGKGIYLSRNQDNFMNENSFINPQEVIYLFKLK
jgi:hypothetical protein